MNSRGHCRWSTKNAQVQIATKASAMFPRRDIGDSYLRPIHMEINLLTVFGSAPVQSSENFDTRYLLKISNTSSNTSSLIIIPNYQIALSYSGIRISPACPYLKSCRTVKILGFYALVKSNFSYIILRLNISFKGSVVATRFTSLLVN